MSVAWVHPRLAFSDSKAASMVRPTEFDEVVTLGSYGSPPPTSTTGDTFIFPDGEHEYERFEAAADYVVSALERDETVLVHCARGVSRSSGVSSAALAAYEGCSLEEAFGRITEAADRADPLSRIRDSMERYTDDTLDDYRSQGPSIQWGNRDDGDA